MSNITERLKFLGNYVDESMSVATMSDLLALKSSVCFNGQTVTVLNLINNIPADFWLVKGKAVRFWRLKSLPQVDSKSILDEVANLSKTSDNKLLIDNGFTATLKSGDSYMYMNGEWVPYSGGTQGPQGAQGTEGEQGPQGQQGGHSFRQMQNPGRQRQDVTSSQRDPRFDYGI